MNKTIMFGAVALAIVGIGGYLACDTEDDSDRIGDLAIEIHPDSELPLRDNPSKRPTSIVIGVEGVTVHHTEQGWIDLETRAIFDLLDQDADVPKLLGAAHLPNGMYDQLRFEIQFATVQVDRKWYPLEIPSGEESGLKIHTTFCMVEGDPENLQLRWDVDESLKYNDARGYWMNPSFEVFSPPSCTDDLRTPPVGRPEPSRDR